MENPDTIPESSAQPHPALSIPSRDRLGLLRVLPWKKKVVQGVKRGWEKDASDLHAMWELQEWTEGPPWVGRVPLGAPHHRSGQPLGWTGPTSLAQLPEWAGRL